MRENYGTSLDLNLLRVFSVVADCGSVTRAASQLYLTQPAVSAALRRLNDAVGEPLFVREGRGIALTHRGQRLLAVVRPHLRALVDAALSDGVFDPLSSETTFRLGLPDTNDLLPQLLRQLSKTAPLVKLIVVPVQFRTVEQALSSHRVDMAVSVADELPASLSRQTLYEGGFVCLFDPRHVHFSGAPSTRDYFAHEHVVVSYNGDLRGIVEDSLGRVRKARCSVASFANMGAIVEGTNLLATVPEVVAQSVCSVRPKLRYERLPIALGVSGVELLYRRADENDPASKFLRDSIHEICSRYRS